MKTTCSGQSTVPQPLTKLATDIEGLEAGHHGTTGVVLRLYIAGTAPNSVLAIANLEAICREYLKDGHKLEVVDVLEHPRRAMAEGVLVTPSLAKLSPLPAANVVGNLSDHAKVLSALGLKSRTR